MALGVTTYEVTGGPQRTSGVLKSNFCTVLWDKNVHSFIMVCSFSVKLFNFTVSASVQRHSAEHQRANERRDSCEDEVTLIPPPSIPAAWDFTSY